MADECLEMLLLAEVAERLRCSPSNVYSLIESGRLLAVRTGAGGKGYRVDEKDLQVFIEESKTRSKLLHPIVKSRK